MLFNRAIVRLLWTGGVALSLPRFARSGTTEDWPAFTRNVCKNPGKDIFIDFEEGLDGIQVAKTYPEVKFTNTLGLDWVYLDVRTNQYNANGYNDDTYAVNGNKGTWLVRVRGKPVCLRVRMFIIS